MAKRSVEELSKGLTPDEIEAYIQALERNPDNSKVTVEVEKEEGNLSLLEKCDFVECKEPAMVGSDKCILHQGKK
jgi:hypothetical protein